MSNAYPVKESPDGSTFAPVIPSSEREELWRAFYTVLDTMKDMPIRHTERGEKLRKLGLSLRGDV
jgi:hypothetical protein